MSIADKLLYLNQTKRLIRESLNPVLAERGKALLSETDPFREYAARIHPVLSLFENGEQGWWYDSADISTLFQDAAGTIPVTASGDPVGLQLDRSGRGNHRYQTVSADRPIYVVEGGIPRIRYNGINQGLRTDTIDFTATDKITFGIGVFRELNTGTAMFMEMSPVTNNNIGAFYLTLPEGGNPRIGRRGTRSEIGTSGITIPFPILGSITAAMNYAEPDLADGIPVFRYNGDQPTVTAFIRPEAGGGNFGNYPFYFARRGGASLPWRGDEFSNVVVSRLLNEMELDELDQLSMLRSGVTA